MALKNHALDDKILHAAQTEFLENGYENASMRKIAAAAGVTIGAIYTRYATKDALFCGVVQPLIDRIAQAFASIRSTYYETQPDIQIRQMAHSMDTESACILHLLFDDYDRAVLLLCRSTGSSLESFFDTIIERKIQETVVFFRQSNVPHPSEQVLRLLIGGQFHMYAQIIHDGYDLAQAKELMQAAMIYHTGGWLALIHHQTEGNEDEI